MGRRIRQLIDWWNGFRHSSRFHEALVFLAFVGISALFGLIMALNDSVQRSVEVRINVTNVPDSVTFIQFPPQKMHVSVRDKGTALMRTAFFRTPVVNMDFQDFASDGVLRFSRDDINAAAKSLFGASAVVSVTSLDSVRVTYTSLKGKRVPVVVVADITASSGNVVEGRPISSPSNVLVYSTREVLDTITRVYTERVVRRNLSESVSEAVSVRQVAGARIIPAKVDVKINVQPLVNKESKVDVVVKNVPEGMSLLLFPSKVTVSYFVPMSRFNDEVSGLEAWVDYDDIHLIGTKKLPVRLGKTSAGYRNISLRTDSVEYTLVRN